MKDLLKRLEISGFDVDSFFSSRNASSVPNIALSFSGGGYRALQNGGGVLAAFDSRTDNSTERGHLGGLLQSATYVSGLSGGAWLTASVFVNNFTSVQALRDNTEGTVWNFDRSILEGPQKAGGQTVNKVDYLTDIAKMVQGKQDAGFDSTLTDYWGRGLSFQMIDSPDGGASITWSSIAETSAFKNGEHPMPIIIADERAPGETLIARNTTVFEFNPFEMGTWDPTAFGFVPMQYLGSNFSDGSLSSNSSCVVGFDNAGFLFGTSSSLFNILIPTLGSSDAPQFVKDALRFILGGVGQNNEDIADYPNPFQGVNPASNPSANSSQLTLVDGGLDFQNIPLHPVIQPVRELDVIFAVDSSADTTFNWPNGTALVATYERNQPNVRIGNGTAFAAIPDVNTMVNLGLNNRPTFFGCNATNITDAYTAPLIVYIPHAPYIFNSNVSTFDPQTFNDSFRNAIVRNGYNVATQGNATVASEWPQCVGCAIIKRSLERAGQPLPGACQTCFSTYCWDGTLNATEPPNYEPKLKLAELKITGNDGGRVVAGFGLMLLGLGIAMMI